MQDEYIRSQINREVSRHLAEREAAYRHHVDQGLRRQQGVDAAWEEADQHQANLNHLLLFRR